MTGRLLLLASLVPIALSTASRAEPVQVDLKAYDPASGVKVERRDAALRAEWSAGESRRCGVTFSVEQGRALLESVEVSTAPSMPFVPVARNLSPEYALTVGSRTPNAPRFVFF